MKKIAGIFIVFGFVLAAPTLKLHAQKPFEGTITWAMTIPMLDDDKHLMTINTKGDKSESEVDLGMMGTGKSYKDESTKKIYVVQGASKTGFTMDLKDHNISKLESVDIKPSGNKETIAGHPAEEYLTKGKKGGDISIWFAADMPKDIQESFYNSLKDNPSQDPNAIKAIQQFLDKGLLPVRIVLKDAGDVAFSMELVKYERKSLDDSLFVLPADVKFGPMPTGMGGGGNGTN